ncbi:MAG: hypothetical protein Q9169_006779 [Polycauliona sp. 2 TL-2023]
MVGYICCSSGAPRLLSLHTAASPAPRALSINPRIQCDHRTKPPLNPSHQACSSFMDRLSVAAHKEPVGSFKYYARNIGTCSECVDLPAVLHFGRYKCATLIDVDDEYEKELDLFGLHDLWAALNGVVRDCWLNPELRKRSNGRGYPSNFWAWAAFVPGKADLIEGRDGALRIGNRTVSVIDLGEGWLEKASAGDNRTGVPQVGTA